MKKKTFLSVSLMAVVLFVSCTQGPTLQSYFVEKMDDPNFLIVNLPFKLDQLFTKELTEKEQEALASVGKLNLLFYRFRSGEETKFDSELKQLSAILTHKKYQHLMDFKAFDKGQGKILFEGETDKVEEGIILFSTKKMGFGVLRILGSEINPAVLMGLVKKVDPTQLEEQLKSSATALEGVFENEI
jgi:hypothetical protein